MDIDDLRILNAVVKNGSMNRAAAELHMVQSNVTARVRQLEDELGVSLFVRHSRGVALSDAGQRLLAYAGRIDALFQEAIASVKENGVPKGALRIGSTEPTVSLRLPAVLAEYAVRYPAVELTVTTGNTADLIRQVTDQSLDAAFVAGPVGQAFLKEDLMFRETLALVTGLATPTLDDLRKVEGGVKAIVLAQGCSYVDVLAGMLEGHGIRYQVLPLASFDAMRSLVQSNVGVTLLPKELLAGPWRDAAVSVHEDGTVEVDTVLISRSDHVHSAALEAFLLLSRASSNLAV